MIQLGRYLILMVQQNVILERRCNLQRKPKRRCIVQRNPRKGCTGQKSSNSSPTGQFLFSAP
uniref:Uncharacterized protein n=1 Tax=Rhizophora mucronata TaxID=61149 RepID=A0A2P2QHQ0_RHIMU